MKKVVPASSPDAYVAALKGWQRVCAEGLRANVNTIKGLTEVIKWGNLVYLGAGPVVVIRAEESRVLLGYWRGQRMQDREPRLKAGGKYEMATITITEGESIAATVVRRLTREAVQLDSTLGDPTKVRPAR